RMLWIVIGVIALLTPAMVEFGRFNSQSTRFLFLGGLAAAWTFGLLLGEAWAGWRLRWHYASIFGGLLFVIVALPAIRDTVQVMRSAWRHPESRFLSAREWLCGFETNGCADVDVIAASRLRHLTKRGDVILTNLDRGWPARTVAAQAVVATLTGAYVRGAG